jgi:multidrug efflux pump subunit AcrB
MSHRSDAEIVRTTHNTARFFTETRQLAWVLLAGTFVWGIFSYFRMPQRKDPDIPVRVAVALCPWPGSSAEKIEQLVTRKIEEKLAENSKIDRIDSVSRTGLSVVYVKLIDDLKDTGREFDDMKLKLDAIHDLPDNAGPIQFIKDFGDTAALMLTVASPKVSALEIELRARTARKAIEQAREAAAPGGRVSLLICLPQSATGGAITRQVDAFRRFAEVQGAMQDPRAIEGPGFIGVDGVSERSDDELRALVLQFAQERLRASEIHPDAWPPAVIRQPAETESKLAAVAGDKYSYRELDDFSNLIKRTLQAIPVVSKVAISGLLDERIYLDYSQERLAAYGITPSALPRILQGRNVTLPGGMIEVTGKNLTLDPSGEFLDEREIGDVLIANGKSAPVYLRDLVSIARGYASPPRYLNFYTSRDAEGRWQRNRAVTLSIQMRQGERIGEFAAAVDGSLAELKRRMPGDLIMARTSDQPLQVKENVDLFMGSLYEAIALVVLVSLIGFWEWRSALLMALSIPITLAMTFGFMHMFGIDLQQVSIASLIISLGLLVDDPVVAGDAIKRDLAAGRPRIHAAWLGPTKLATAILFATITNIVAYLPFLFITGDMGTMLYSLPIVIAASLVASRIVSMTFIPLLGYYLLRPKAERPIEERRRRGFASWYYRVGTSAIRHRWAVLAGSLLMLALGGYLLSGLKTQFLPKDLSYFAYLDIWLAEDAPLQATMDVARRAEVVVQQVALEYGKEHADRKVLHSITTFVGGGGPRFWSTVSPELDQLNYAQVLIQVEDKHDTEHLVPRLQAALSRSISGAEIDVCQLDTAAVGIPVAIRISGEDALTLRRLAEEAKGIFRSIPSAARVRDNWGAESFSVKLRTDPDRANLSGVSNQDVAASAATAMSGYEVTKLRDRHKQIPVLARLRMEERAQLGDVANLYVYSSQSPQKVPLGLISSLDYGLQTEKIQRRNQFRTITVSCYPQAGALASEVLGAASARLAEFAGALPPGYRMEIGGEYGEQVKGFRNLAVVMTISVLAIFLALVVQFRSAVKPLIVFAAIPYGTVGAIAVLAAMQMPFGFMAFLGVASLVGVIVSHVIVLFDFIEEKHEAGAPLEQALLDAGIMRLRPVLITVGATVIALFPLAAHGGPLWEPMCYAQIGGLTAATVVTLVLVPVIYSIFVLDLRLVKWGAARSTEATSRGSEAALSTERAAYQF